MTNFIYSKIKSNSKPQGGEVAKFQKKDNYCFANVSVKEMATLISEGRAWRAGIYPEGKGTFKKGEVLGSTVIALDFDNCDFEPEQVCDYAIEVGLIPNFYYYSYSQGIKPKNNFRIVWLLENMIKKNEYENIYIALLDIFKEFNPDIATKDCSRLWFGSNKAATILNEELTSLASIGWAAVQEKIKNGGTATSIIRGKKDCVINYAGIPMPEAITVSCNWWEKLRVRCSLWDKYEKGEYLNYNQRLTLFTNLKFLKYGDTSKSIVQDLLQFYNADAYKDHTFNENQLRSMLRDRTLKPLPIVLDGTEKLTIPEFFSKEDNEKTRLNSIEKCSLKELDSWMDENVPKFLSSGGITYLKSQTASGKTERIIRYLIEQDLTKKKIIYCAPTFNCLKEFKERFLAAAASTFETKPIYLMPKCDLSAADKLLLQLGLPKKTRNIDRSILIQKMLDKKETGLFLITHALLVNLSEINADLIIIDENIEDALLRETKLSNVGINALAAYLTENNKNKVRTFADNLENYSRGDEIDLSDLRAAADELEQNIDNYIATCPASLILSGFFNIKKNDGKISQLNGEKCVRILNKSPLIENALKQNIPVKLFSATPKSKRLDLYYDTKIEIIAAPLAKNEGEVIQFRGKSGAKGRNFSKLPELSKYIKSKLTQEQINDSILISFKGSEDFWREEGFHVATIEEEAIHLMNNAGLDCFKGKKIIIPGKFDYDEDWYLDLFYDTHDIDVKPQKKNQVIELNGFTQKLFLWEDEDLRAVQIQNIQLAIEQTCGRARALREAGATVYLFSNFVVGDVDKIID